MLSICDTEINQSINQKHYRLRNASNPSSSWGIVDQDLWLHYMFYGQQSSSPSISSGGRNLKCYPFNLSGMYSKPQCVYMHKCLTCSGAYPYIRCFSRPQLINNSDFRPTQSFGALIAAVQTSVQYGPSSTCQRGT